MSRLSRYLVVWVAACAVVNQLAAFGLVGPTAAWQTLRLGYNRNMPFPGGPMDLGEEYRFNVPVVFYGFTPDFLNYFGQRGVQEIDKAFKMINEVPSASSVDLNDFTLTSQRVNHRAAALGLVDLKSFTLTLMLQEMGLGDPVRFVYTLRSRWIAPGGAPTNFYVIRRNFDPVTWRPTSYINGQLWTYPLVTDINEAESFVFTAPVDPLAFNGFMNAPVASGVGSGMLLFGGFWSALTRDDVGGIRYIYRKGNYNVENVPTNAALNSVGGGPWGPPPGTTNAVTNIFGSNVVVNIALRGGIERVQFKKVNNDSTFGIFEPFTNTYSDTFITNATEFTQFLSRGLPAPDILFDVADLQGGDATDVFTSFASVVAWTNNDPNNGLTGNLGPGVVEPAGGGPGLTITFNSVGEMFWNIFPNSLSETTAGRVGFFWASFDGSTNDPVVYPLGVEVSELERRVLRDDVGSPWGPP